MSGRLIITTKKTYCPWSQQNVERVLRDERLERERIEREARSQKDAAAAARRREIHGDAKIADDTVRKHVNLFPEAEEAELRLANGGTAAAAITKKQQGVMPVPLGGEEATNKKLGRLPFYMQTNDVATKPNTSNSYTTRVMGRQVQGDVITGQIMRDQAVSREESRKVKNDPMMRFYQSGQCRDSTADNIQSEEQSIVSDAAAIVQMNHSESTNGPVDRDVRALKRHKHSKKSHRKERKRRNRDKNNCDNSSVLSSDSSSSHPRSSKRQHKQKHKRRRREHKHSRHDSLTKSSQHGSIQTTTKQGDETLAQLRQKRLEREACENARAQSILGHQDNTKVQMDDDRGRGYHDQWNPMLSRN